MIEEFFISRLNKGDAFILAGRVLEIVNIKEQEVQVKLSSKTRNCGKLRRWKIAHDFLFVSFLREN